MKNTYTIIVILLLHLFNSALTKAAEGDFGAWNLMDNHSGMNCGHVGFSEKELTLEFWIYIDEQEGKNIHETAIVSNRHDGNYGFTASLNKNSKNNDKVDLRFWFKTDNDAIYAFWLPREEFLNKWNHVAFVVSSKEKKAFAYLNAVLYNQIDNLNGDWKGNIRANGSNVGDLWLAAWYTSPKLHGKLADVRVWNVARSATEIVENYKTYQSNSNPGLQKYYTFSDEVFAQKPHKFIVENDLLTWSAQGESWEVEVRDESNFTVLQSEIVTERSYSLAELPPNCVVYVRTISNGFFSDWSFKSDIIKVGCVGDSNTYGAEATDRSKYAWPAQIRSMLGNKYETRNFGVNGALMMDHMNDAWKNKTAYIENKSYDPDIIVVALGTNDSKDGYWNAEKFKTSYVNLIDEFKTYPASPQVYMTLPIKAYSSSWSINDKTIRENVIPVIKEISKEKGLPLIDLYIVTNDIANLMAADGIHPKDAGLQIMARKISDMMLLDKPVIKTGSHEQTTTYAEYYWYKDDELIADANGVNYTVTANGVYKVAIKLSHLSNDVVVSDPIEITQNNTLLSAIYNIDVSNVSTTEIDAIKIVSNPEFIYVNNGAGATLSIYDLYGKKNKEIYLESDAEAIHFPILTKGVYICRVQKNAVIVTSKIIR